MASKLDKWLTTAVEKVFKNVTDAKLKTLYDRAKNDPQLARQLKDMEDNLSQAKVNIKQMADLLKKS